MISRTGLALLCIGSVCAGRARAEVALGEKEALARAFSGADVARRTLYLTNEQIKSVEKAARSKLPSAVVTVFEARSAGALVGRALLDTHVVRTMPETVLVVVAPDGTLAKALVLRFGEPPDYMPREGWLRTLEGKRLDDDLWPDRGIRRVTGSTLTVQALTEAIRRCLAIHATIFAGTP
jgi:hypothetical protein